MQCDVCHKSEATVHLTEIVNDKVTKLHLCEECARAKGEEMETHFGLSDLLAGLADLGMPQELKSSKSVKCSECGFTFADFQRVGRLGCPACYDAFQGQLTPLMKRIHGTDIHVGKYPLKPVQSGADNKPNELMELKAKLQNAISSEAFEEAAVLRDKIKMLEAQMRNGK